MKILLVSVLLVAVWSGLVRTDFNYPMKAQTIADNVCAIVTPTRQLPGVANGGWNSSCAFGVTGSDVLLFGIGSSTAIRDTIATVTPQPVRCIVNSHTHSDHRLGNVALDDDVEISPTPVFSPPSRRAVKPGCAESIA